MSIRAEEVIKGLKIAIKATGAEKGVIALKSKYKEAISVLEELVKKEPSIEMHVMGNYYPAGDEQVLVYEVTGRIVPEKGIPPGCGSCV